MTRKEYHDILAQLEKGEQRTMSLQTSIAFNRWSYIEQQERFKPEVDRAFMKGDWKGIIDRTFLVYELMPYVFYMYYDRMPEELRRDFVVGCYEHHGDSVPACRKALRALPKNGLIELPARYRDKPEITVYRAGEEEPCKAKYRLSWTLDKKIAQKFYSDLYYSKWRSNYLYKAKIRPCDVIAYTNGRKEKEVLQYRKVYDIQVLETKSKYEDDV